MSRGLGDVYKRQGLGELGLVLRLKHRLEADGDRKQAGSQRLPKAVSFISETTRRVPCRQKAPKPAEGSF